MIFQVFVYFVIVSKVLHLAMSGERNILLLHCILFILILGTLIVPLDEVASNSKEIFNQALEEIINDKINLVTIGNIDTPSNQITA